MRVVLLPKQNLSQSKIAANSADVEGGAEVYCRPLLFLFLAAVGYLRVAKFFLQLLMRKVRVRGCTRRMHVVFISLFTVTAVPQCNIMEAAATVAVVRRKQPTFSLLAFDGPGKRPAGLQLPPQLLHPSR